MNDKIIKSIKKNLLLTCLLFPSFSLAQANIDFCYGLPHGNGLNNIKSYKIVCTQPDIEEFWISENKENDLNTTENHRELNEHLPNYEYFLNKSFGNLFAAKVHPGSPSFKSIAEENRVTVVNSILDHRAPFEKWKINIFASGNPRGSTHFFSFKSISGYNCFVRFSDKNNEPKSVLDFAENLGLELLSIPKIYTTRYFPGRPSAKSVVVIPENFEEILENNLPQKHQVSCSKSF